VKGMGRILAEERCLHLICGGDDTMALSIYEGDNRSAEQKRGIKPLVTSF